MVDFFKHFIDMLRDIEGMINGAGGVEQDHADDEDCHGARRKTAGQMNRFGDQRKCCDHSQDHSDKMSQGAAWIFDSKFHMRTSVFVIMEMSCNIQKQTLKTIQCSFQNYVL